MASNVSIAIINGDTASELVTRYRNACNASDHALDNKKDALFAMTRDYAGVSRDYQNELVRTNNRVGSATFRDNLLSAKVKLEQAILLAARVWF